MIWAIVILDLRGIIKPMAYRIKKQAIIVTIVILFLGFIGLEIYLNYLKPVPSCFDGIKNQDEFDIDCGGACVTCEIKTIKNIDVVWAIAIPAGNNSYDLAANIRNPNPNFGHAGYKYNFVLKDASGQIIGQRNGNDFILPGETKYVIEANFQSSVAPSTVSLQIDTGVNTDWLQLTNYQAVNLYIQDKGFTVSNQAGFLAEATGVVKNGTNFGFDTVTVNIVLFDRNKKPIGVSKSVINTLTAGEGRYFSAQWFAPFAGTMDSFDMQAQTNLFSDSNFMRIYGVPQER